MVETNLEPIRPKLWRRWAPLLLIWLVALLSQSAIYTGQFYGEDEALQWMYVTRMIAAVRTLDITGFIRPLAIVPHPPLRYFLSMPGTLLFPHAEFGVRLGAIIASLYMTYLVYQLGKEL